MGIQPDHPTKSKVSLGEKRSVTDLTYILTIRDDLTMSGRPLVSNDAYSRGNLFRYFIPVSNAVAFDSEDMLSSSAKSYSSQP